MRILCIVKQVPDSNASIKVKPDGSGVDPAGLKLVADPFDEFGIELAVQLREKRGDVSEIVAITLGTDKASEVLRTALAIGADRGIHITDPSFDSLNEIFLAQIMAEAIRKQPAPFDLILCGKQTIDLDSGAMGPALAEFLELPHVGAVTGLEIASDAKTFEARRRIEGAEEVVQGNLPVLLTIEKGLVEARYPSLPNLMKAKQKPVATLTSKELTVDQRLKDAAKFASLSPPAGRAACTFLEGEPPAMAKELVRRLREEAKAI